MTGRTHDLAAITALGVVVVLMTPEHTVTLGTAIAAVFANLIGGIAPDIDQPTAPFGAISRLAAFLAGFSTNYSAAIVSSRTPSLEQRFSAGLLACC